MGHDDDGFTVTITGREIYDQIVGLREDMSRVVMSNEALHEKLNDHEGRIRGLERWKYGIPLAGLSAVAALIVQMR